MGGDAAGAAGSGDPALLQQQPLQRPRGASPTKGGQQASLRNYFGAGAQRTQEAQQQTLHGAGGEPGGGSGGGGGQENGGALAGVKRKQADSPAV